VTEGTVQHDFDDDVVDVNTTYPFEQVITKVQAMVYPREVDSADVVLAQLQKSFQVAAGEDEDIKLLFRNPDTGDRCSYSSLATRVSGTDYVANASEDGSGADRTADMTVTVTSVSGNAITLNVANGGASAFWVTTLQQKGKGINRYDPVSYEAVDSGSYVSAKGERVLRYDMPYEDRFSEAENQADRLLSIWKDPICLIDGLSYFPEESATLTNAFLDIDIGKRITVAFTQLGIDQDYFVHKETVTMESNKLRVSYLLKPATSTIACRLDDAVYGVLNDSNCKLA